ncbi:unnamed protein product [Pleuronectes platessa]|uniref:Uncharacterized protein n=1 Tax=Pleuronectes platessa TaxID=8262 RepID=A0A9N7U4U8_PLEPL|nr:unnamed protein product [Pleuronectes platessa]
MDEKLVMVIKGQAGGGMAGILITRANHGSQGNQPNNQPVSHTSFPTNQSTEQESWQAGIESHAKQNLSLPLIFQQQPQTAGRSGQSTLPSSGSDGFHKRWF